MLAGIVITLLSLWVGQHHGLMPVAASQGAVLVDGLFNTMMTISFGLFVLVEGVIVIALIKFRRKPGDLSDGPPIEGNIPLEIVWTAIPAVIILVIGVYSFDVYNQMGGFDPDAADDPPAVQVAMLSEDGSPMPMVDSAKMAPHHHHIALGIGASPENAGKQADVTVDVLGIQYAWIFTYPDTGIVSGELHVPVGKDVRLNIKAQDVLHAFWLPEFRIKQDAIPGRDTELRFVPDREGDYPVICAELCGAYHGSMVTRLYVHSPEDFDAWKEQQIASQLEDGQTVASRLEDRIAALTGDRSDEEFLAPYATDFGVNADWLHSLHAEHQGMDMGRSLSFNSLDGVNSPS
jgi:cytochrome c oxidase subunit 2